MLERDEAIAKLIKTVKVAKNYHRDNGNKEWKELQKNKIKTNKDIKEQREQKLQWKDES